ncbi:hypothetical protein CIPAW_06G116200 [Carya illinoinensis]|uniref:Uncharacterized protein n=1 Tax=Carya illinoinensis TaxID=32201 RepID=A0A8T1QAR8_CARIL|nr:hypothetical protein CIPAW_06G116200 [Carya illinoinensis]
MFFMGGENDDDHHLGLLPLKCGECSEYYLGV